jgi:phage regulator Rha-like protein
VLKKETASLAQVEDRLLTIRDQSVLLDSDVAALYGVETREVNQAIKNNPDKFPEGYIIRFSKDEWESLRSKILISKKDGAVTNCDHCGGENEVIKNFDRLTLKKYSTVPPKAFTEKGLYMLATILKGSRATQTTIAIVETFSKIRELARTVAQLAETNEKFKQQALMEKSGEIMADILGEDMKTTDTETSIELNLAVLKFKHTVRKKIE